MSYRYGLLLVFCVVSPFVNSQPEISGTPQEVRELIHPSDAVVTLSGSAEEIAYSDTAIVSLVVTTEDELLSAAIAENTLIRGRIAQQLMDVGLDADQIKSSKFSSSPQYGWFGREPDSYEVVNRMAITIDEEDHLQDIAGVSDEYSEVELSDTAFTHSQVDEFNTSVRAEALADILEQKTFYEESLGVSLTPIGIRDSNIRQRGTRGAFVLEEIVVTSRRLDGGSFSSAQSFSDQVGETSFDEVVYEATLWVEFKID